MTVFFRCQRLMFSLTPAAVGVALLACMLLSGCGASSGRDLREERDPMIQRALVKKRTRDVDGAIELLYRALESHPGYARPDLELGLLYDEAKEDYIRAVFHYERYLEKRPTTEKKQIILELIRSARLSYAASLPFQPDGAIDEIRSLKDEIKLLHKTIRGLENETRRLRGEAVPVTHPPGGSGPQAAPPSGPVEREVTTYVVQGGDSLMKISRKVYGDTAHWQHIYEANRGTMASPQSLHAGQTLIIPPRPQP